MFVFLFVCFVQGSGRAHPKVVGTPEAAGASSGAGVGGLQEPSGAQLRQNVRRNEVPGPASQLAVVVVVLVAVVVVNVDVFVRCVVVFVIVVVDVVVCVVMTRLHVRFLIRFCTQYLPQSTPHRF